MLYTIAILLALVALGYGFYSHYQIPQLAIENLANWLQYLGFQSFLSYEAKAAKPIHWILVILLGIGCSAASFLVRAPILTIAIENVLSFFCFMAILGAFLRRNRPVGRQLSFFIILIMSVFIVMLLLAIYVLVIAAATNGLYAAIPKWPLLFGPLRWLVGLIMLALLENLLVSGALLEEKAINLRESEKARSALTALNDELKAVQRDILGTMAVVFEKRTVETAAHVNRVAGLTEKLLIELGYEPEKARFVGDAARLHDIGKVGIPDTILKSANRLTALEREQMQLHVEFGHQILTQSNNDFFQLAARIAVEHHEHWDGSGYPKGLRKMEISIETRAVTIVDTFDALTSRRSYKDAWETDRALSWIESQAGHMFDPEIVSAFLKVANAQA